jgi:hypothetical protein
MLPVRCFMERFPDEEACRDYLFHIRWPRGFICTKCGETKYSHIHTRNLFECTSCRTQTSITSDTVMHRTKLPLRYWLLVFYWVASGERCSARKLSKTLKLQYKTALRLLHAVREAMLRANRNQAFAFWKPTKSSDYSELKKAKQLLLDRAQCFIRKFYRRISERRRESYFNEYWFRNNNSINLGSAINKLIGSGASTIWVMNEYRKKIVHQKEASRPPIEIA